MATTPCLPVPNATIPFWRTNLDPLDAHRSTEELPSHCDILVIGAGYAGASTVHHILKQQTSPLKILLLEAREACSGASGRNGGHIKPDMYYNILKYSHQYTPSQAASFARFEAQNVLAVKHLVEEEGIDCDFVLTRAVDVYLDEEHSRATLENFGKLKELGKADLGEVEVLEGREAVEFSKIHAAKSCFSYPAAHLHPYKLVLHLLRKAIVQGGVNLQTHTPVTSISDTRNHHHDGGKNYSYWTITTPRGLVHARKVIFCTNAYTGGIAPMFRGKIIPVKGVCCRILVDEPSPPPSTTNEQEQQQQQQNRHILPTNTYSLRHARSLYDYLIPRAQDNPPSIILGGAKPVFWHQHQQEQEQQQSSPSSPPPPPSFPIWYNNPNDNTLFPPPYSSQIQKYFHDFLPKHFISSSFSSTTIDKIWSGIMGWSTDSMPWIGAIPIPNPRGQGQFILAGFSGHGMPVIYLAAKAVARMVLDELEDEGDEDEVHDDEEEEKKGEGEKERRKTKRKKFEEMGLPGVFEVTRERLEREGNDILGR